MAEVARAAYVEFSFDLVEVAEIIAITRSTWMAWMGTLRLGASLALYCAAGLLLCEPFGLVALWRLLGATSLLAWPVLGAGSGRDA